MAMTRESRRALPAALVLLAAFAACGPAIDEAAFRRIEEGMTEEEVAAILGEPAETSSVGIAGIGGTFSTWKADDGATITVQFVNGKVVGKQFHRGEGRD